MTRSIDNTTPLREVFERDLDVLIKGLPEGEGRRELERIRDTGTAQPNGAPITIEELVARSKKVLSDVEAARSRADQQMAELRKIDGRFSVVSIFGLKQKRLNVSPWSAAAIIGVFLAFLLYAALKTP